MAKFIIPIPMTSVSASVDLFELVTSATRPTSIEYIWLDQKTLTSGRLNVNLITGTATSGSGGSTSTPICLTNTTATFGGTSPVEILNTTKASTGTPVTVLPLVWNLVAGLVWLPAPEHRIIIPVSTRAVLRLEDAPASAMTAGGFMVIDE